MSHVGAGWPPASGWQILVGLLLTALMAAGAWLLNRPSSDEQSDHGRTDDRRTDDRSPGVQ